MADSNRRHSCLPGRGGRLSGEFSGSSYVTSRARLPTKCLAVAMRIASSVRNVAGVAPSQVHHTVVDGHQINVEPDFVAATDSLAPAWQGRAHDHLAPGVGPSFSSF